MRIGIHTGLVVVGEIGSREKREILALGETPNIAARLQGLTEPDTVVISGATYRLVQGLFTCQDLGAQAVKGLQALKERTATETYTNAAFALWSLGYPDQALKRGLEALTLAQELSHSFSLAFALTHVALLYQLRREEQKAQEWTEALITLCTEQGFPQLLALGTMLRGWVLAEQGQGDEGIVQMQQGLTALRATGQEEGRTHWLAELATAHGKVGQTEEGLTLLAEALAFIDKTGERVWEARLYRLKGELILQSKVEGPKSQVADP